MPIPTPKPGAQTQALSELPLDHEALGVRLTQADFARLIGCTRAHVSGLVSRRIIPTRPGGRIEPNEAVAALLRRDPDQNRLKVLVDIRRQLDDAEHRALTASEQAARLRQELQVCDAARKQLERAALEAEYAFDLLINGLAELVATDDPLQLAFDKAIDFALDTSESATDQELRAAKASKYAEPILPEAAPRSPTP